MSIYFWHLQKTSLYWKITKKQSDLFTILLVIIHNLTGICILYFILYFIICFIIYFYLIFYHRFWCWTILKPTLSLQLERSLASVIFQVWYHGQHSYVEFNIYFSTSDISNCIYNPIFKYIYFCGLIQFSFPPYFLKNDSHNNYYWLPVLDFHK